MIDLPLISVMICFLSFEIICALSRLFFLKKNGGLSIKGFVNKVFFREVFPITATVSCTYFYSTLLNTSWDFVGSFIISFIVLTITSYFFGLCSDEKIIINKILSSLIKRK